jgi:hypothetical protein
MPTFDGWTIVPLPAFPACPKSIEWEMNDVVGSARSPFSLQQQIYQWNQSILRASVSYQTMTASAAKPWLVFFALLQGISGVFSIGDPANTGPQNSGATAGTVSGSGQTGYSLVTTSSGLLPGDWIQIGLRLYMVTSSSSGTLGIWPCIRESPTSGTALIINGTTGLFRLQKNSRKYSVRPGKVYSISFEIEEAL